MKSKLFILTTLVILLFATNTSVMHAQHAKIGYTNIDSISGAFAHEGRDLFTANLLAAQQQVNLKNINLQDKFYTLRDMMATEESLDAITTVAAQALALKKEILQIQIDWYLAVADTLTDDQLSNLNFALAVIGIKEFEVWGYAVANNTKTSDWLVNNLTSEQLSTYGTLLRESQSQIGNYKAKLARRNTALAQAITSGKTELITPIINKIINLQGKILSSQITFSRGVNDMLNAEQKPAFKALAFGVEVDGIDYGNFFANFTGTSIAAAVASATAAE